MSGIPSTTMSRRLVYRPLWGLLLVSSSPRAAILPVCTRTLPSRCTAASFHTSSIRQESPKPPKKDDATPVPPTPDDGGQPTISQEKAEEAVLSKMSTLSPAQITTLLSTPSSALPSTVSNPSNPPHSNKDNTNNPQYQGPQPPRRSPRLAKALKWTGWIVYGIFSISVGYFGTKIYISRTPFLAALAPLDEDRHRQLTNQERSVFFFDYPFDAFPLSRNLFPKGTGISTEGYIVAPPSPHVDDKDDLASQECVIAWPANIERRNNREAPENRTHFLTSSLDTVHTLGLLCQVYRDRHTGELSLYLSFGRGMSGWPGLVHGGAMATVMDEAMTRGAANLVWGREAELCDLKMMYRNPLPAGSPVVVRMAPMSAGATRAKAIEIDAARRAEEEKAERIKNNPEEEDEITKIMKRVRAELRAQRLENAAAAAAAAAAASSSSSSSPAEGETNSSGTVKVEDDDPPRYGAREWARDYLSQLPHPTKWRDMPFEGDGGVNAVRDKLRAAMAANNMGEEEEDTTNKKKKKKTEMVWMVAYMDRISTGERICESVGLYEIPMDQKPNPYAVFC